MMLEFMYCPDSFHKNSKTHSMEMFQIAHKYGIESLIELCHSAIISQLNIENCVSILKLSDLFNNSKLKEAAMECIVDNNLLIVACVEVKSEVGEELWKEILSYFNENYQVVTKKQKITK